MKQVKCLLIYPRPDRFSNYSDKLACDGNKKTEKIITKINGYYKVSYKVEASIEFLNNQFRANLPKKRPVVTSISFSFYFFEKD
jgi:hypothetical protein